MDIEAKGAESTLLRIIIKNIKIRERIMPLLRNIYTCTITNPISKQVKTTVISIIIPFHSPNVVVLHNELPYIPNQHYPHLSLVINKTFKLLLTNKRTEVKIKLGNTLN